VTSVTTKRLVGSRLSIADLDILYGMHRDPVVMATLGGIRPPGQTRAFLAKNLRHWQQHGFGLWIFRDKVDGGFVGRGGLRHVTLQGCPDVEISYALIAACWGKGFATEIATASVELAAQRGMPSLVAFTLPDNHGSLRVMEKLAFRYERDILWAGMRHVLYRRHGGLGGHPELPNK
jgi:ribosomal-protein-alanine N-acetyltransferase